MNTGICLRYHNAAVTVGKVPRFRGFSKSPQKPVPRTGVEAGWRQHRASTQECGCFCFCQKLLSGNFFIFTFGLPNDLLPSEYQGKEKCMGVVGIAKGPHCVRCVGLHGTEEGKYSRRHCE